MQGIMLSGSNDWYVYQMQITIAQRYQTYSENVQMQSKVHMFVVDVHVRELQVEWSTTSQPTHLYPMSQAGNTHGTVDCLRGSPGIVHTDHIQTFWTSRTEEYLLELRSRIYVGIIKYSPTVWLVTSQQWPDFFSKDTGEWSYPFNLKAYNLDHDTKLWWLLLLFML